jgi:hypothetical protein
MMKNLVYLLAVVLISSCGESKKPEQISSTATDTTKIESLGASDSVATKSTPSSVAGIKEAYALTMRQVRSGSLDSISHKYNCNSERAGTITYFLEKGNVKLIKHSYNEYDHFAATDEYFVSNNVLFFAHLSNTLWSFETGGAAESATKDNITEQRIYIVNKQPLQCLEKKYIIRSQDASRPNPEDIPNKEVRCKPIQPLLKTFSKLLAFREAANHNCFEK